MKKAQIYETMYKQPDIRNIDPLSSRVSEKKVLGYGIVSCSNINFFVELIFHVFLIIMHNKYLDIVLLITFWRTLF